MKNFPKEFQLLLLCASYFSEQEKFCDFKDTHDIDWELFLSLLHRHRVLPMVCHNMHRWGIELPIKNDLKIASLEHSKKSLQQTALLLEINKLFNDNGIECVHFKGPSLSWLLYQDTSLRQYKDIDILIERKNIDKAVGLLIENGFNNKTLLFKKNYLNIKYQKIKKDYSFEKNNCEIELHWGLFNTFSDEVTYYFFKNTKYLPLHLQTFQIFDENYYLSYLILHGYSSGWSRLHWLIDIVDFVKSHHIDWSRIKIIIDSTIYSHAFNEALELINLFFFLEKPIFTKPSKKIIRNSLQLLETSMNNKIPLKYHLLLNYRQFILMHKGMIQKFQYFKKTFATSHEDWRILPLPKFLFFLYYPLRPFLWFIRKIR